MNYTDLMVAATTDDDFRQALLADPKKVLTDQGFPIAEAQSVRIEESREDEVVFVLPPALPDDVEIDDDALASVAGGTSPLVIAAVTGGVFGVGGFVAGYKFIDAV